MRRLAAFETISLDGYFTGPEGDMSWAHSDDPEWNAFVAGNAQGGGELVFGRLTYEEMVRFWPTPMAEAQMPEVAKGINASPKTVFSRTLAEASWNNTRLVKTDPAAAIREMKREDGPDMVILGSGSIVAQLGEAGLIDEYQLVIKPVALGAGRTLFEGISRRLTLALVQSRAFANGNLFLRYAPAA